MSTLPAEARSALAKARKLLHGIATRSGIVLFAAPDDRLAAQVKADARRVGMPHIIGRWIGGTLTNHASLRRGVERLEQIETWEADGRLGRYSKKEKAQILREKRRLLTRFDGLRGLVQLPAALIVLTPTQESPAIAEARKIGSANIAVLEKDTPDPSADIAIQVDKRDLVSVVGRLADALKEGKPPEERAARTKPPRPRGKGPGTSPVLARLRPRPSPQSGRAKADLS